MTFEHKEIYDALQASIEATSELTLAMHYRLKSNSATAKHFSEAVVQLAIMADAMGFEIAPKSEHREAAE